MILWITYWKLLAEFKRLGVKGVTVLPLLLSYHKPSVCHGLPLIHEPFPLDEDDKNKFAYQNFSNIYNGEKRRT